MRAQLAYTTRECREAVLVMEINKLRKFDNINGATLKPKKKRITKSYTS